jgi:hypothetical protein
VDEQAEFLMSLLSTGRWLDEPVIQRAFRQRFGSIRYKPAMDAIRKTQGVEHRYIERRGKWHWAYRLIGDA